MRERHGESLSTMKKIALTLLAVAGLAAGANASLIITGLADPDGGSGDILELYSTTAIPDLSAYSLESAANANSLAGTLEFTLSSGSLAAGEFYYLTTDQADFTQFLGFAADDVWGGLSINGNDTVGLYNGSTLIDRVLGDSDDSDVHGDGWIYRKDGEGPNGTFTASEWTAFTNVLGSSNDQTNAGSSSPFPLGTYAIPEPGSALLFGLGLSTLIFVRRHRRRA